MGGYSAYICVKVERKGYGEEGATQNLVHNAGP